MLWGGDQVSDFWSLRVLVAATLSAAASGFSNWSHDVGGYLGHRLVERCPAELLVRWVQLGCFTPLMQAHGRLVAGAVDLRRAHAAHLPLLRPAARAARPVRPRRRGRPRRAAACRSSARCTSSTRPTSAAGRSPTRSATGPSLWVAPVLDEGARSREVALPRGDVDRDVVGRARARRRRGRRPGAARVDPGLGARGLDRRDLPGGARRARPRRHARVRAPAARRRCGASRALGSASVRLADGTRIAWRRGRWSVDRDRTSRSASDRPTGYERVGRITARSRRCAGQRLAEILRGCASPTTCS